MKYDFEFYRNGTLLYSGLGDSAGDLPIPVKRPIIVDIGSYDGGDSILLKEAFPDAVVHAIEGSSERFEHVRRNCLPFGIVCHKAMISSGHRYERFSMRYVDGVPHCGTLKGFRKHPPGTVSTKAFEAWTTTLSAWTKDAGIKTIDILHMDVEGAEMDVLLGMGSLRPYYISMETNGNEWFLGAASKDDLLRKAYALGYEVFRTKPNDVIMKYKGQPL